MVKWKTVFIILSFLILVTAPSMASAIVHGFGTGAKDAICNQQVVK